LTSRRTPVVAGPVGDGHRGLVPARVLQAEPLVGQELGLLHGVAASYRRCEAVLIFRDDVDHFTGSLGLWSVERPLDGLWLPRVLSRVSGKT
jgi:hypothetical protein